MLYVSSRCKLFVPNNNQAENNFNQVNLAGLNSAQKDIFSRNHFLASFGTLLSLILKSLTDTDMFVIQSTTTDRAWILKMEKRLYNPYSRCGES